MNPSTSTLTALLKWFRYINRVSNPITKEKLCPLGKKTSLTIITIDLTKTVNYVSNRDG